MKRICAIILCALFLIGGLVGCNKQTDNGTTTTADAVTTTTEDGVTTTVEGGDTTTADDTVTTTAPISGGTTANNANKTTTTNQKVTTTTKKVIMTNPSADISDDLKGHYELPKFNGVSGTTVELFTWGSAASEGSKRWIEEIKRDYGITLTFSSVAQNVYDTTLSARMMSANKPDVILVPTSGVYTYALNGYLEDVTDKVDLNAPLWKGVADINRSRFINGRHYLIATGTYVNDYIWFNREMMEDNGITDTPDKLYERGEWTIKAMIDLAKEFTYTDKGTQYYGLSAHYQTLGGNIIVARGAIMAEQNKSGKFVSRTGSSEMADAMGMLYDMYNKDKVVMPNSKGDATLNTNAFYYGQVAMCQHSFSLSSQSRFAQKMKDRKISFVPFPKWDEATPYRQRGTVNIFAVAKGSDNVNGALAFINHRRFGTADLSYVEESNAEYRRVYNFTDKELQYRDEAKDDSVMASWEGLPKQQLMTMCQNVSNGGAWPRTLQIYEPQFQQGLQELNALMSK